MKPEVPSIENNGPTVATEGEETQSIQELATGIATVTNIVLEAMDGGTWYHCKGGTFQMVGDKPTSYDLIHFCLPTKYSWLYGWQHTIKVPVQYIPDFDRLIHADKRNLHSFLLCYRQFGTPEALFAIIMALCVSYHSLLTALLYLCLISLPF